MQCSSENAYFSRWPCDSLGAVMRCRWIGMHLLTNHCAAVIYLKLHRDTAVPADGNGDLQTLICVLVLRPGRCPTLSNPVPWQNWMAAYLGYTLRMRTLFRGWPVMVHDTHMRRRRTAHCHKEGGLHIVSAWAAFTCLRFSVFRNNV